MGALAFEILIMRPEAWWGWLILGVLAVSAVGAAASAGWLTADVAVRVTGRDKRHRQRGLSQ